MSTPGETRGQTPGQTVGPFFGYALPYPGDNELVPPGSARAVRLHGRVLDGEGAPVPDAVLELWQPGPDGQPLREPGSLHRDGWTFTGWGRTATDGVGHYGFSTLEPSTSFLALTIFARGLLDRLFTRVYLPGHEDDALLSSLDPERRATLVAARDETEGVTSLSFDVHLQGERETVFLSYPRHG